MTITEFLSARIACDEDRLSGRCTALLMLLQPDEDYDTADPIKCEKSAAHMDYHGTLAGCAWRSTNELSARELAAECKAKRQIVELRCAAGAPGHAVDVDHDPVLRALARLYTWHPDFNPRWRL